MMSFLRGAHIVPFRGKIDDVIADSVLIPKVNIAHPMGAYMLPELCLCRRHVTMQFFCAGKGFWGGAFMHDGSDPLPASPN
jgi:hypothetical protein